MPHETELLCADLRVDLVNECVWRGQQALRVRPTASALLRYLAEHAGRLVSKDELLQALWPEAYVTEGVLTTHMRKLRQALGDDPKAPRFIETVHRRGYRFIAAVQSSKFQGSKFEPTPSFVGRETELGQLHQWLEKALRGARQVVFVTGE